MASTTDIFCAWDSGSVGSIRRGIKVKNRSPGMCTPRSALAASRLANEVLPAPGVPVMMLSDVMASLASTVPVDCLMQKEYLLCTGLCLLNWGLALGAKKDRKLIPVKVIDRSLKDKWRALRDSNSRPSGS